MKAVRYDYNEEWRERFWEEGAKRWIVIDSTRNRNTLYSGYDSLTALDVAEWWDTHHDKPCEILTVDH